MREAYLLKLFNSISMVLQEGGGVEFKCYINGNTMGPYNF